MTAPPILRAVGLRRSFGGRVVLRGLSLHVSRGEVLGLLGPNGAGKTTTFRLLTGAERAEGGEVWLGQVRIDALALDARARAGLGYLPQEDTLFRDLNVEDNVAIALQISGRAGSAKSLLERVGIAERASQSIQTLSGGERRRLAIARLLAIEPAVLLLDEPFAGIDPISISGLQRLIRGLAADGAAVLLTDHAVRETLGTCDRAMLLDGGELIIEGTPAELAAHPHARARYLGPDFVLGG